MSAGGPDHRSKVPIIAGLPESYFRRSLSADQSGLPGTSYGVRAPPRIELHEKIRHVRFDRAFGDEQPVRDLLIREAVSHKAKHFVLTRRHTKGFDRRFYGRVVGCEDGRTIEAASLLMAPEHHTTQPETHGQQRQCRPTHYPGGRLRLQENGIFSHYNQKEDDCSKKPESQNDLPHSEQGANDLCAIDNIRVTRPFRPFLEHSPWITRSQKTASKHGEGIVWQRRGVALIFRALNDPVQVIPYRTCQKKPYSLVRHLARYENHAPRRDPYQITGSVPVIFDHEDQTMDAHNSTSGTVDLSSVGTTRFLKIPRMAFRTHTDQHRSIELVTRSCEQMLGYARGEMLGRRGGLLGITVRADREFVRDEVEKSVQALTPLELVYRMQTKSGAAVWVFERSYPSLSDGRIVLTGFIRELQDEPKIVGPPEVRASPASEWSWLGA